MIEILGLHHVAVETLDLEASVRFYRDLLGMTVVGRFGRSRAIVLLDAGNGAGVELFAPWPDADIPRAPAPLSHLALQVADAYAAVETVRAAGFAVVEEPVRKRLDSIDAVIAFIEGPSGETIELIEVKGVT